MNTRLLANPREMYAALARRDTSYEGQFVVGVQTTGIFCRPGCPARTPRPENVEFFADTQGALLAGYRPCKRCRPLEPAGTAPEWIAALVAEIEAGPEEPLRDADLRQRGLDPVRVRRWFRKQHGMTFHAYQRCRRLGEALGHMQEGVSLDAAGFDAGYESNSGFREAFGKLFGQPPGRARRNTQQLMVTRIATPLGPMLAAAGIEGLCLLEFVDRRMLQTQIDRLRKLLGAVFVPGENPVLAQTRVQLGEYFAATRRDFDLPLCLPGTEFQRLAWAALQEIPWAATRSYAEQAAAMGRPAAVRAVGRANGDNRVAIVVPCHRVLGADGQLCGYGGQLWRKQALLDLEQGRPAATLPGDA